MEYFYTPPDNIASDTLTIEGDEFAHLTHVMRKKVGDAIRVVDGCGNVFDVVIEEIRRREARCAIRARQRRLNEPRRDVTLAVALLKNGAKFDVLVEKCTELGVNAIIPLVTERTLPRHARSERWQKLALAAMKQSMRCVLPKVHEACTLQAFLASVAADGLKLLPHEKVDSPSVREVLDSSGTQSVFICIGPEGGFSDDEVELARSAGFRPATLGSRRLRTETAAIVSSALALLP
jgi:16S rRNA (uracil1498-N3)-methyltransferase